MSDIDALTADVVVPVGPDEAFAAFVGGLGRWWPREFSWSGPEHVVDLGMTPEVGSTLWEVGAFGARWDWGVVLAVDPPTSLRFSWQIGPDRVPVPHPDLASWVDVRFDADADGDSTRVAVSHDGFDRHGEQGQAYRDGLAGAWPYALEAYASTFAA